MEEQARPANPRWTCLRTHFLTTSLSVHPCRSCPHPQLTEEAARLPCPGRKASPTSYLQRRRLNPEPKEAAALPANPHQPSSSTGHPRQLCPRPEPKAEGPPHLAPRRKASPTSYLQQRRLNPEPKEAAALPANPRQPLRPTAHLEQHCPQPELTGEGRPHLALRRTTNSTAQPSCLRSELMEEAAQLASHPYRAP
jgi:hypothetical protein